MRRFLLLILATSAMAVMNVAAAGQARSLARTRVALGHTAVGTILVTGRGLTLYAFSRDGRNHDRCVRINGCAAIWPLLNASGTQVAGHGVKASLLGTIRLALGARQMTYGGHPLYTYVGDPGPGSTQYVGASQFGGTWSALDAAGRLVK